MILSARPRLLQGLSTFVGVAGPTSGPRRCLRSLGCWRASASFSTGRRDRPQSKSFDDYRKAVGTKSQEEYIRLDAANCAPNYVPTPVVISRGEGVYVWDIDGNKYLDFVAGISVRPFFCRFPFCQLIRFCVLCWLCYCHFCYSRCFWCRQTQQPIDNTTSTVPACSLHFNAPKS